MSELTPGERLALAKKEVNGDYKDVIIANQEHTYMVYQPDGNILYKGLTEPDMSTYDNCKSYKFNTQDVAITDQQGMIYYSLRQRKIGRLVKMQR